MEKGHSNLRKRAIEVLNNYSEIEQSEITLKIFLQYLNCYCIETKQTEYEILSNDKNFDNFYQLFNSVMIEKINNHNFVSRI